MKTIPSTALFFAAWALSALSLPAQETFPYSNDFSSDPFPEMAGGEWTLDSGIGVLNYFWENDIGGDAGIAVADVAGAASENTVVVSSWFTVKDIQGSGTTITAGFGAFSESGALTSSEGDYYLTDWEIGGGGGSNLRLIAFQGGTNFLGQSSIGRPEVGETYELRLTVVESNGEHELTLAVFDESGAEIGSLTETHGTPITGEFFGLRNRTPHSSHVLDLDYHNFGVGETEMPAPPPALVEITNLNPAPDTGNYTGDELSFTVSTQEPNTLQQEDIQLYLNDELIPQGELTFTGSSPSYDVSYGTLEPGRVYTARVVARDNERETVRSWTFDTLTLAETFPYANDFSVQGLPEMTGGEWNLDADIGILNYSRLGNTVGRAVTEVSGAAGENTVVVSTWFTPNEIQGSGTTITAGFGAFSESGELDSGAGDYYLTDWQIGGGGGSNLRLIAFQGGTNILNTEAIGRPEAGETYELRLTVVEESGEHELTLAVFDDSGAEVGSVTATHGTPIAGEFFGLRNRTPGSDHVLDLDYHNFGVGETGMPAPPPVLVEITNPNPAPDTGFHPAVDGLNFTVSTDPSRELDPSDIEVDVNGEAVPREDLTITGSSPSFDVSYDGLVPDVFYTVEVAARDNERGTTRTWSFNTLESSGAVTLEDTALNQSTADALQGLVPESTFDGDIPEGASLARLTDAASPTAPTDSVIPSTDEPVELTWDLGGTEGAEYRTPSRIDLWLAGSDPWRTGFDGELAVSNDGVNFTPLPDSRITTGLTYTGDPIDGVTEEGTGTGNFNLVSYHLDPADFDGSFRYLRLISYGYDNLDEGILRQPRLVEADLFVETSPPFISAVTPVEGTPFHAAGDGVSFTVSTEEPNTIATEDIELYLNGEAVPNAELMISGSSPEFEVAYADLESDALYSARAVVRDNERETSFVWGFDTFTEEGTVVLEAEDYNFTFDVDCDGVTGDPDGDLGTAAGGEFIDDPVPSRFDGNAGEYVNREDESGTPIGYVDRVGVPGIDYSETSGSTGDIENNVYRFCDPVGTVENATLATGDFVRPKYVEASAEAETDLPEYHVHQVQDGEWLNYTRTFPEDVYRVYLRASVTGGSPELQLARVTSDPTAGGQETEVLGGFAPAGTGAFQYTPLTDESGEVFLSLSGEETLRVTAVGADDNLNLNYLVFVPATAVPPQIVNVSPSPDTIVTSGETLSFEVTGPVATPQAGIALSINGVEVTGDLDITGDESHWFVSYEGLEPGDEILIEASNAEATASVNFTYPLPVRAGDLLWTNADAILRAERDGGNRQSLLSGLERAIGIAVDAAAGEVYFADDAEGNGVIGRINFDGSGREDLLTGRAGPQHLALTQDRIFWTEYDSGLWSADRGGGDVQNVIPLTGEGISALAIDSGGGKVYVASSLEAATLYRADLDGGALETLTHITLDPATFGLALDSGAGVLYATDYAADGGVTAHDLDTGDRTLLYGDRSYPLGIALSEDGGRLYWAERNFPAQPEDTGRILGAPADGEGEVAGLAQGLNSPFGVALVPPAQTGNFAEWIDQYELPEGQDGPGDNPSGDGIANLIKYALGGDPTVADRSILPVGEPVAEGGEEYLSLSVERDPGATATLVVEVSGDLVNWFSGSEHTTVLADTASELVVRDNVPVSAGERRFIRLRVVE